MNRFLLFCATLLLAGCAQPEKAYYVLTASGPVPSGGGVGIGVGPVALAEYLDRPNLVTQQDANQLGIAEDHRWAGDLTDNVSRVVAADLGRLLHTGNVRKYPWQSDSEIDYQVTLEIRQLHSQADGFAVIEAGWRIYSFPDRRLKASKTFTAREPLDSDGYNSSVAAQSRLLQQLSETIAASLR